MGVKDQALNTPKYPQDKIIGVLTDDITMTPDLDGAFDVDIPTKIDDTTLLEGVFTVDDDPQYQNINSTYYINDDRGNPFNALMYSKKNYVTLYLEALASHRVKYRIYLIAKKTQGQVTPLNIDYDTFLTSKTNYRKIFKDEIVPISIAAGATFNPTIYELPVSHNLGYYPSIRRYAEFDGKLADFDASGNLGLQVNCQTVIDESRVTFILENFGTTAANFDFHYRIYYDEH